MRETAGEDRESTGRVTGWLDAEPSQERLGNYPDGQFLISQPNRFPAEVDNSNQEWP
jgi:hypothetical protein